MSTEDIKAGLPFILFSLGIIAATTVAAFFIGWWAALIPPATIVAAVVCFAKMLMNPESYR